MAAAQGRPVAGAGRLRRAPPARADDPERLRARPDGGGGPDRGDLPHLDAALAALSGRLPAGPAQPREDHRPHRRVRGRPAHRHDPPRRRRGRHPQRRLRGPVRPRRASGRVDGYPGASDHRLPRAGWGNRARGCRCSPPRCRRSCARCPACGSSSPDPATPRGHARGWPPEVAAACEFLGPVSDEDKARLLDVGRPLRRAQHRRGELRDHPHRGDERGRAGAGQRPAGVRRGCSTAGRPGRRSSTRTRATWRAGCSSCSATAPARQALAARGRKRADVFDWSVVAADVMAVYETVIRRRRPGPADCRQHLAVDPAAALGPRAARMTATFR